VRFLCSNVLLGSTTVEIVVVFVKGAVIVERDHVEMEECVRWRREMEECVQLRQK
jgi:hypothetical protein